MGIKLSEAVIQRQCLEYLRKANIFHWRSNNLGIPVWEGKKKERNFKGFRPVYRKGLPDIFVIIPTNCVLGTGFMSKKTIKLCIFYGIEIKSKKGVQSQDQKQFQKEFEAAGGIYCLVRSLDELMKELK